MTAWIMSIVGVVVIGVLIDVLTPEGESNKYVKGVYALIVVLVIASPIAKALKSDIDFSKYFDDAFETDSAFVESVNDDRKDSDEQKITNYLKLRGYENAVVVIFQSVGNIYGIDRVNVDLTMCTQTKEECEEEIKSLVGSVVNCDEVRVYDNK